MNERFSIDPNILHGKPHIRGTRIPIDLILGSLAAGMTEDAIVREYPPLTIDDIQAAVQRSNNR